MKKCNIFILTKAMKEMNKVFEMSKIHYDYLKDILVCGLCFGLMKCKGNYLYCPRGCSSNIDIQQVEEAIWQELSRWLKNPKIRSLAKEYLGKNLSDSDLKHIFHNLGNFLTFLPVEDKKNFLNSLIEKVEVISSNSITIYFRV